MAPPTPTPAPNGTNATPEHRPPPALPPDPSEADIHQSRKRRSFTAEYRVEAARRVIETGRPIAQVARELGIGEQLLGRWVHAELARQAGEPTGELSVDERAELKRLRRENEELRKDNEFLGKAAAFFASKPAGSNGLS